MNTVTILISSCGTASAISIIKALRLQREMSVRLIAIDSSNSAAGLYLADAWHLVPNADQPEFMERVCAIVSQEQVAVVIPTFSAELNVFAQNAGVLARAGAKLFLPPVAAVELCNDKIAFAGYARRQGCLTPEVYEPAQAGSMRFPVFVKPRFASSSRGAARVDDVTELSRQLQLQPGLLVQQYVPGAEYTVDVFCDASSAPRVMSARVRKAVKSGQCTKGTTVDVTPFRRVIERLCADLKMTGACNFQFISEAETGRHYLIEINPRFAAGGLMLTVKAGANIPLMVVKSALGKPIADADCVTRIGLNMTRYWEEIIY